MSAASDNSIEQAFNDAQWGVKTLPSRSGGPDNEFWVDVHTGAFAGITAGGRQPNFDKFAESLQRVRDRANATRNNRVVCTAPSTPAAVTGVKRPYAVMQQSSQSQPCTQATARAAFVADVATQPTAEQLTIQTVMHALHGLASRIRVLERVCHVNSNDSGSAYE